MQIFCHGLKEEDFPVEFSSDHKIFIGRDESNSIAVIAEGVSRFHAILIEEGDGLFLQDNDSLNGTFLNYKQVRGKQKLINGDIIQIGYRLIRVDFKPEQDAVVLDFVPPEETEVVFNDSAAVLPAPGEPERTMVASDEIERTMLASETMLSRSSMPDKSLLPGGTEIGKYVVIKRLGKGGMGEVYLAKHKTLGICRALKVLSKDAEGGDARFLERFLREAKLASEIRHPNVVGVMDVETGEDCGFPYIVMEYVDGGSLRNSLTATKRLSEEQAVVIVEAVASALQAAEEHNIVHRDIKPDNIMFTRRGEVKLADLGIAKVDGKDNDFTKTNMMIGTPAYLPPEQAQNAKAVDARADIYSLGATFYEMLTGQQPYPGENSIEVLHKLFLTPVPNPRNTNPDVSAASAAIVMKMMAKDPKDRFQNATELLNRMERTFPPHTASEAAELVQKAVAGVSQSNASFSSNISSSRLSLWWLKLPNKKFVIPVAGLVFAICVLCILFPFLGKRHKKQTEISAPVLKSYGIQVSTLPGSKVVFSSPDYYTQWEETADSNGMSKIFVQTPGTYSVTVSLDQYQPGTRVFDVTGPGNGNITHVYVMLKPDNGNSIPDTTEREVAGSNDGMPFAAPVESQDDKPPVNDSPVRAPAGKTSYNLMINTTYGATISYVSPDGKHQWNVKVDQNYIGTTVGSPGKYTATIFKEGFPSITRVIDVYDDVTIDLPLPGDPLVVTTGKDVVDANDGVVSLREAFIYIRSHNDRENTICFSDDFEIRLLSAIVFAERTIIDGGKHHITIIGPKSDVMFRRQGAGFLRLKNLSLTSDYSGGILDSSFYDVKLTSINDGGKAEYLWRNFRYMRLENGTHLHRLLILAGTGSGILDIQPGTAVEDLEMENGIIHKVLVSGLLKNASIRESRVFVCKDGVCENLSVRNGLIEHYDGGTINGLNIGIGTLYGYEPNAVLTGTVTVGGMVLEPAGRSDDHPIVGNKTDLVFDLTDRTENPLFDFNTSLFEETKYDYSFSPDGCLIQNMKAFTGARSYTVQVKTDQSPGKYRLAGNAKGFNASMHLRVGNAFAYSVLTVGKPFIKNQKYSLSIQDNTLILTIIPTAGVKDLNVIKPNNGNPYLVVEDDLSCTIRVRENQVRGTYRLARNAEGFNPPVTLQVGTNLYRGILYVGKSFSVRGRTYTLSLTGDNKDILTLTIK